MAPGSILFTTITVPIVNSSESLESSGGGRGVKEGSKHLAQSDHSTRSASLKAWCPSQWWHCEESRQWQTHRSLRAQT